MISTLFVRDRRLLVLTIGLIVVAGLSSFVVLPRMEDPLLAPRAASITTLFPGADAERVESLVTEKIEDELKKIEEIKELRSVSRIGVSFVNVELRDEIPAREAPAIWSRIRGKLDDAELLFPEGALQAEFDEIDVKAFASLIALKWTAEPPVNQALLSRLTRSLEERIRTLGGTAKTELFGDPQEEIVVSLDPEAAAAQGLTAADVSAQIRNSDAKRSAGQVRSGAGDLLMEVSGELDTLSRVAQTPVRVSGGSHVVQLKDVAEVEKAAVDPPAAMAVVGGKRAVVIGVLVRDDARIDLWAAELRPLLADFSRELPAGVELQEIFSQTQYVEQRLDSLASNLLLGAAAVALVIWLMMGWKSALIVGSALPLSSLIVISALRWLGIPIHQMSVTGIIIALGLLIDNAIVMVDEVVLELREGHSALNAVSRSVRRMAIPLLGSTLTTALAFGPIALMPGPAGEFVGSIALSVIIAVMASLGLALTVIPALAALYIRILPGKKRHWFVDGFESSRLAEIWGDMLRASLRRPALTAAICVVIPLLGMLAATRLPMQFFPPADRDQLYIEVELASGASLAETAALTEQMRKIVLRQPHVTDVHWFIGESAPIFYYNLIPTRKNTPRYAQAFVQRDTADDVVPFLDNLQQLLDREFPQALTLVRQMEQGPPFYAPIEVRLFGPDLEVLRDLGDEVRLVLSQTPLVISTRSELNEALPKVRLQVDEPQARLLNLDHAAIAQQLNSSLEGITGGTVLEATEELPVRVRIGQSQRADLNQVVSMSLLGAGLASPTMAGNSGRPDFSGIPLTALMKLSLEPEISGVPRFNGQRMNEVQAFLQAGRLPAPVLADFQSRLKASGFKLPPGYSLQLGGETSKRNDAIGNLMANVGVLSVLIVATLVLSFQSFRMASLIGIVGGLSVGLGMGSLWLFGYPFGFMAIIGTMGLIGVAINDSIVVLAAIKDDPAAASGDQEAIRRVLMRSTRHVLATTFTTIAGFLPLIVAGGGFWPPLAVSISGGVGGATALALFFIPAAYILMSGMKSRLETSPPVAR